MAQGPLLDNCIQFILSLTARAMGRIARVARQFGLPHRRAQARKDAVLVGADQIVAVAATIDVGGRDAGPLRPRPFALRSEERRVGEECGSPVTSRGSRYL